MRDRGAAPPGHLELLIELPEPGRLRESTLARVLRAVAHSAVVVNPYRVTRDAIRPPARRLRRLARPYPTCRVGFVVEMLFSTKAEYGVRLMVELGRRAQDHPTRGGEPVALSAVAEAEILPLSYLEHLVAKLRQAGLVTSVRGAHGGYRLARPAARDRDARRRAGARGPDRADGVLPRGARGPGALLARERTATAPAPRSFSGPASTAGSPRRWPARPWPTWSSSPTSTRAGSRSRSAASPSSAAQPTTTTETRWPIWRSETCT